MKQLFITIMAMFAVAICANAQVKIQSPHPDLNIRVTRCSYASNMVVIDVVVTNLGAEDTICFWTGSCIAYDDEGNSYEGDRNGSVSKIIHETPSNRLSAMDNEVTFPQDIPIKYRFQIKNISTNATKISLLKLGVTSRGALSLKWGEPIQIRNLELVK